MKYIRLSIRFAQRHRKVLFILMQGVLTHWSYKDVFAMYQMYVYAKKYENKLGTPEVWLLYPVTNEMRGTRRYHFIAMLV